MPNLTKEEIEDRITKRERQVLKLMLLGLNNANIAKKLFVARSTAKRHIASLLFKLEVNNRVQLAVVCLKLNIVDINIDEIYQNCRIRIM